MADIRNEDILKTIYDNASLEYQHRVPDPTQAGIEDQLKFLTEYSPIWNEFQHALVNQIGSIIVRNKTWTNPLAEFKSGPMAYGSTIEEVQSGLLEAHSYSADRDYMEKDLFAQELVDTRTAFHSINREDFYKVTINDKVIKRAFQSANGLQNLLNQWMQAPLNSDQLDEFLITCRLLTEFDALGGMHAVQIPDVRALDSDSADAKGALRRIRALAREMTFLSTKYNAAKMPTFAKQDDLVLFMTPNFESAMDVEALAGAFNIDKMSLSGRVIVLPEEQLQTFGAQAIMTTKEAFVIHDTLIENRIQPNAAGLYTNYFHHHHGIYSMSRFAPMIKFTSETVEDAIVVSVPVTSVAIDGVYDDESSTTAVTDVVRGENYIVKGAALPETADQTGVSWALQGNTDNRTRIDRNGILHIGELEGAASIVVTATALWTDKSTSTPPAPFDTSTTLTVSGDLGPVWPNYTPPVEEPVIP